MRSPADLHAEWRACHPLRIVQRPHRRWPIDGTALLDYAPAAVCLVWAGYIAGACARALLAP